MAKITSKSDLTLGTNLILHIADKGGTDIAISNTNSQLTSTSTDFTASSTTGGVTNRAIEVGDDILITKTGDSSNNRILLNVTAVTANQIDFTIVEGSPVDEAAGSDINIIARKKTYQFLEAGGLSFIDGVSANVLYSELIDLWFVNDFDKYDFPFSTVEPRAKSLANIDFWEPHDTDTLNAIRDAALEIRDSVTSAARRIYGLFRSGDLHASTDQMFFWSANDPELNAPNQAVMTGYINQVFLLFDSDNAIDNRGTWYVRCAEPGKTILFNTVDAQYAEIYTVSAANDIDPKLADPGTGTPFTADSTISSGGIYANVEYFLDADEITTGDVDGVNYDFTGYIEADNQTNEVVNEKINYLWRQPSDINSDGTGPTKRGDKQPPLTVFSGDIFTVKSYIQNYNVGQRNNLRLIDTSGTTRSWPLILTLFIQAAALAHGGTFTIYHADTFGTSAAVVFQNESNVDQKDITIAASTGIVMSYSSYSVDGHTPGTPLDIIIAYNKPGFIEADRTEIVTIDGNDRNIQLALTADSSYIA